MKTLKDIEVGKFCTHKFDKYLDLCGTTYLRLNQMYSTLITNSIELVMFHALKTKDGISEYNITPELMELLDGFDMSNVDTESNKYIGLNDTDDITIKLSDRYNPYQYNTCGIWFIDKNTAEVESEYRAYALVPVIDDTGNHQKFKQLVMDSNNPITVDYFYDTDLMKYYDIYHDIFSSSVLLTDKISKMKLFDNTILLTSKTDELNLESIEVCLLDIKNKVMRETVLSQLKSLNTKVIVNSRYRDNTRNEFIMIDNKFITNKRG